jgi:D-glycero-alpha-D-manno-heptose 1-phosphate guanylyltransferase
VSVTTVIILAGGLGTRLREAVPDLPKPMAPINNRPFLEYQMDYWIDQGINHFILSVGYLKDVIINHFGKKYKNASVEYAEENEPLGTGGGLLMASKNLTEPFLAINGDTFIEVNLDELWSFHVQQKSKWTFSLFKTDQFSRYMGMDVDSNGEIFSLKSKKLQLSGLANGGVYLIDPKALSSLGYKTGDKVSLEGDLLADYISRGGKLFGKEFKGKFIDIGIPSDYHRAEKIITQWKIENRILSNQIQK